MDAAKLEESDLRVEAMGEDLSEAERRILDLQEENNQLRRVNTEFRQRLATIEAILNIQAPEPVAQGDLMDVDIYNDEDKDENSDDDGKDDEGGAVLHHEEAEDQEEDEKPQQQVDPLPFKCNRHNCNKQFKSQATLDRHLARTHDSNPATRKAHVCAVCNASLDKATVLRSHMREHKP